jgi:TetR/AcrR family transcriptional repressor of nem operon
MTDTAGDGKMPAASEVDLGWARPREFDDEAVLDAAVQCFWACGDESRSVKDLMEMTGLTAASQYNAYGDKRATFRTAPDHYIETSVGGRIRPCEALPPRDAILSFFEDILHHSLTDGERKGCMLVNSALEMAPHDLEFAR